MGSERHFHQAPFPPFLDTYSSNIHPFLGMSVPDDSRSQDCVSYICSPMPGAQPSLWRVCPPTWLLSRHEDSAVPGEPHMALLNSPSSLAMAICPCRNRLAREGTTHDMPVLAVPEHPLLCIRKLQIMSWHEFISPAWFCPMEDFPVLDICQWMTRREDFLAFSCQNLTQAHFFGYIASILRPHLR